MTHPVQLSAEEAARSESGTHRHAAKQGRLFLPSLILGWFGVTLALLTAGSVAIPKVLAFFRESTKDNDLALITGIGGIVVMVITPLFGRLSDRTASRWGIRKPWLAIGTAVGFIGVLGLAFTTSLWMIVAFWCLAQIGFGATNMVVHALLADQIPTRIRGRVAAATGVATGIATITGAAIVAAMPNDQQCSWFIVPGVIGSLLCLTLLFALKDIRLQEPPEPMNWRVILSSYWLNPVIYRDFAWAWLCRMLVTMSIVSVSIFLLFFIIDQLGIPREVASGVQAQALLYFFVGNVVMAIVCGWLSDRLGRRKPFVILACLVTAAGLILAMTTRDMNIFMIAILIVGSGQGAYISVDVALMTEVLPNFDNAGKDLGIVALSYQLPQVLVPLTAVPILAIGGGDNYGALFGFATILAVLGGLSVIPIKKVR